MKKWTIALLIGLLAVSISATAEESFPELDRKVPHFADRLRSTRWEARYLLLNELSGRDAETKRALEILARDANEAVANQALVRYVDGFLRVDRSLFKPALYVPRHFPVADLPAENADRALVDYCLGRRAISASHHDGPALPVLDPSHADDARMRSSLTIVGILGEPGDADSLTPFLKSPNAYVALGAAEAVIRLGQRERGVEGLVLLTQRDPKTDLPYVTEALRVLRAMDEPRLDAIVERVLDSIDRGPPIQPNWISEFLLVAADVSGSDVWTRSDGRERPEAPK